MTRLRRHAALCLLALSAWFTACDEATPGTQIVVAVDSNLTPGTELTRLEVRVFDRERYRDGEELRMQTLEVDPSERMHALPLTFLLEPEKTETDRDFRLVVTGYGPLSDGGEGALVEQQVISAFQAGKALRLDVYLSRTCLQVLCWQDAQRTNAACERVAASCDPVQPLIQLDRATNSASAGYTPACDMPPLCVGDLLRTCSADGSHEQYDRCPDDDDPCTYAACPSGAAACVQLPLPDLTSCALPPPACGAVDQACCADDGCVDSSCVEGICRSCGGLGQACCPGDVCTRGSCAEGVCHPCGGANEPCCADGRCGDGNLCNGEEICADGVCRQGTPMSCADMDGCTEDRCDPQRGCEHVPMDDGAACDDGDPCTKEDRCVGGRCSRGQPLVCAAPTPICSGGVCTAGPPERCDGIDNDLDAEIDEDLTTACYAGPAGTAGRGSCRVGERRCTFGVTSTCMNEVLPASETCNGVDDDCDGQIDELPPVDCFEDAAGATLTGKPGLGACMVGKKHCMGGTIGACVGAIGASPEVCGNDQDEDCSGDACMLHAVFLNARKVDDRAHVYRGHDGLSEASEICAGKELDCDLRSDALAESTSPDALRAVRYTLKLSNGDCSATRGEFALLIDGVTHLLPAQALVERVHCGFTHRVAFTVDFLAGTFKVDKEDRCLFDWLCRD